MSQHPRVAFLALLIAAGGACQSPPVSGAQRDAPGKGAAMPTPTPTPTPPRPKIDPALIRRARAQPPAEVDPPHVRPDDAVPK
ncbi:hypothetical protein [Sphingomonas guangdongensis]|uniref:hypothetical protein n=1 Tax=Sphingomonas guangdongensis TaxID=1141890 RepID=UPI0015C774DF|nr:hypothetical protein [Sphingomonas guangdongensis]